MFLLWLRQLPRCGDRTPASVPLPAEGMSSPTNTSDSPRPVPFSYWVLHGSIYSFPLVRYSCPFSTGIVHELLCLKMFSWCICEERCTPCPPTPPPSCSPQVNLSYHACSNLCYKWNQSLFVNSLKDKNIYFSVFVIANNGSVCTLVPASMCTYLKNSLGHFPRNEIPKASCKEIMKIWYCQIYF